MKTIGDVYFGHKLKDVEVSRTGAYVLKPKPNKNIYLPDEKVEYPNNIKFLSNTDRDEAAIILDQNYIKYKKDELSLAIPEKLNVNAVINLLKISNITLI